MILLVGVNHPVSQEDLVSNWEPAHSLVEDALSGAEIVPSPSGSGYRLPLCLWWGQGPVHSWLALLWHLLNPFSVGGPGCALKLFAGKFSLSLSLSLFPLSGYPIVCVAISR